MSDFLHRLAARTLGLAPLAQPIIPTEFAPVAPWQGAAETLEPVAESAASPGEMLVPSEERKRATLPAPSAPISADRSRAAGAALAPRPREEEAAPVQHPKIVPSEAPAFAVKTMPKPADPVPNIAAVVPPREEPEPSATDRLNPPREEVRVSPQAVEPMPALDVPAIAPRTVAPPLAKATPAVAPMESSRLTPTPAPDPSVGSQPPVIRVTIGRIDVRAVFPPATVAPTAPRKTPPGTLSLDDYMKQRSEGKR